MCLCAQFFWGGRGVEEQEREKERRRDREIERESERDQIAIISLFYFASFVASVLGFEIVLSEKECVSIAL